MQAQRVRDLLNELYKTTKEPTIDELYQAVMQEAELERYKEMKLQLRYVANKLSQAFEVFGSEPDQFWTSYDNTCGVVELEGLTDAEKTLVTLALIQRITEEFGDAREKKGVRLNIALDDAYRAIATYYGKETPIARIVREGRKYGFAMIISTQLLKDMPESIIGNTAMKFIHAYHDPYSIDKIYTMLGMTEIERDILYRMPVGKCFLFDLEAIQKGKVSPAFVEIDTVSDIERKALSDRIRHVEMEKQAPHAPQEAKSTFEITKGLDIPDVSVFRFLLALRASAGNTTEANKMLKEKGWVKSSSTLYGSKTHPSLLQRSVAGGYTQDKGGFTKKADNILIPAFMIERQGIYKGAESHKKMMMKVIDLIHSRGNYAFVPSEKDSFDVGEIQPDKKIKGWWDYKALRIYEIQTDADKAHLEDALIRQKDSRRI